MSHVNKQDHQTSDIWRLLMAVNRSDSPQKSDNYWRVSGYIFLFPVLQGASLKEAGGDNLIFYVIFYGYC